MRYFLNGITVVPTLDDLYVMAKSVITNGVVGSWSPWRTQRVIWSQSTDSSEANGS